MHKDGELLGFLALAFNYQTTWWWTSPHAVDSLLLQQSIANRTSSSLEIWLDDLEEYNVSQPDLLTNIERNTFQYLSLIADAADAVMPQPTDMDVADDVFDIML